MIRAHEFNSQWWGQPVAIVDDPAFFALGLDEQRQRLAPFVWAEFRSGICPQLPIASIHRAGFFQVDTQVHFRIGISTLPEACGNGICPVSVRFATDPDFCLDEADWALFAHERYWYLPGVTPARINSRYTLWARMLAAGSPGECLQVLWEGEPQGWFLSRRTSPNSLDLTLGAIRRNAKISGYLLYRRALEEYARLGYRMGQGSFSVSNSPVHNIYAQLGARFVNPVAIWFWNGEPLARATVEPVATVIEYP